MDVRKNLKAVIKDRGYIQAVIAKKAGMSPCKLSQVINLDRKLEANEMLALCEALNMSLTELVEYKPEVKEVG